MWNFTLSLWDIFCINLFALGNIMQFAISSLRHDFNVPWSCTWSNTATELGPWVSTVAPCSCGFPGRELVHTPYNLSVCLWLFFKLVISSGPWFFSTLQLQSATADTAGGARMTGRSSVGFAEAGVSGNSPYQTVTFILFSDHVSLFGRGGDTSANIAGMAGITN